LLDSEGFIRLCDFGSATKSIYRPDDSWNALMRAQLEEDVKTNYDDNDDFKIYS
jgi:hypothetical protein